MKFFLNDVIKKQYGDNTIDKACAALNYSVITRNHKEMLQLCSLLHRTIKHRDALFSYLEDAVLFSVDI